MRELFQDAFAAVWDGRAESDGFNALVLGAGLTWRQVVILRAVRQVPAPDRVDLQPGVRRVGALVSNAALAAALVDLFEARFDPDRFGTEGHAEEERAAAQNERVEQIDAGLDAVASLDHDRIIRALLGCHPGHPAHELLPARGRRAGAVPVPKSYVSFKLDPKAVPGLPAPRPMFEIWVYCPRVEGVHLRFGKVARGGLRWSDRREDFRTEMLGLVKAQMVKNAVIVPTGVQGRLLRQGAARPDRGP